MSLDYWSANHPPVDNHQVVIAGVLDGYRKINSKLFSEEEGSMRNGSRRFIFGLTWVIPKWESTEVNQLFKYSGYGASKLPSLYRTYVNAEAVELLKKRISGRQKQEVISLGMQFGTGKKTSPEKTGECLSGIGFFRRAKGLPFDVHIFCRSSEGTRRLIGDLKLINDLVCTISGVSPSRVTISFGMIYGHMIHWPLWTYMCPEAARSLISDKEAKRRINQAKHKPLEEIKYAPLKRAIVAYRSLSKQGVPPLFSS